MANNPTRFTKNHLAFNRHKSVRVLAKSADGSVYGIEYQGQRGLASAKHIREERIVSKSADLQMVPVVAVEWLKPVAAQPPPPVQMQTVETVVDAATLADTMAAEPSTVTPENSAESVDVASVDVQPTQAPSIVETETNSTADAVDIFEPEANGVEVNEPLVVKKTAYLTTGQQQQQDNTDSEKVPKLEVLVQPLPTVAQVAGGQVEPVDARDPQLNTIAQTKQVSETIETNEPTVVESPSDVNMQTGNVDESDTRKTEPEILDTLSDNQKLNGNQHSVPKSSLNVETANAEPTILQTHSVDNAQQHDTEAENYGGEIHDDDVDDDDENYNDDDEDEDEDKNINETTQNAANTTDDVSVQAENDIEMALEVPVDNITNDIPTLPTEPLIENLPIEITQPQEQKPSAPLPVDTHRNGQEHNHDHNHQHHNHNHLPQTHSDVVVPPTQLPPLSRLPLMQPPLGRKLAFREDAPPTSNFELPVAVVDSLPPLMNSVDQQPLQTDTSLINNQFEQPPPAVDTTPPSPTPPVTVVTPDAGIGSVQQVDAVATASEEISVIEATATDSWPESDVVGDVWSTVSQWFGAVSTTSSSEEAATANDAQFAVDEIPVQFGKFDNLFDIVLYEIDTD